MSMTSSFPALTTRACTRAAGRHGARCAVASAAPHNASSFNGLAARSSLFHGAGGSMAATLMAQGAPNGRPVIPLGVRCSARKAQAHASYYDDSNQDNFYVTTPLFYVNASPHMGSAYPTIAADAIARFQRLNGKQVTFVTGTDEHGEKIAEAAESNGKTPQEHCDGMEDLYKALWTKLDIKYDSYVRTTQPKHEKLVLEFLQRVVDKGDIYRAEYEGLYCVGCEEYKVDTDLLEGNLCPVHQKECDFRKEDNFFFKLSNYQSQIEKLLEDNPDFVRPSYRRNEVLGWVQDGVRDFSISRAAVEWGIPVPADPSQTVYVWFDALLGYLSALIPEGEEATLENATSRGWPASVHVIGKDILRFHAVYWPGMLMSAGLPLPGAVYGHGFLTKDGMKMGKSLGNVIDPQALVDAYGADAVRYFLLKEIEFGRDGDFSEERFLNMVNANLANDIGNLLNRTLNLLQKNCGGSMPCDSADLPADHPLVEVVAKTVPAVHAGYENLQFSAAMEAILSVSGRGNLYVDETAPWTAFKKGSDEEKAEAGKALLAVLEAVRVVAVCISPVAPTLAQRIYEELGLAEEFAGITWEDATWGGLKAGHCTPEGKPSPVFLRLESAGVAEPVKA